MIFRILIGFFVLVTFQSIKAQNIDKPLISRNTVYGEFLGNAGLFYNITYDRIIYVKEMDKISTGLGFQYLPTFDHPEQTISSISPQINYLHGIKHHLEIGIGASYDFNSGTYIIPIRIGYRYQKPEGGMFYELGLTPFYLSKFWEDPAFVIIWGGIAIGWTF